MIVQQISGTVAFFKAMTPVLVANLTHRYLCLLLREDHPVGTEG